MDFKKTPSDVGMHWGKLRDKSVKIRILPKNLGCFPLAIVIMTTPNGRYLPFSGKHPKYFFIISDLFRSLPTSHGLEVNNIPVAV